MVEIIHLIWLSSLIGILMKIYVIYEMRVTQRVNSEKMNKNIKFKNKVYCSLELD